MYNALQAVEPNWLISLVFPDRHCGQLTCFSSPNNTLLPFEVPTGGAIPYSRNFFRPDSDSQSVVQAGVKVVSIVMFSKPLSASIFLMSSSMVCMAGQPE